MSDFAQALPAKEAENDGVALAVAQFGQGDVNVWQRVFLEGSFVLAR